MLPFNLGPERPGRRASLVLCTHDAVPDRGGVSYCPSRFLLIEPDGPEV